VHKLADVRVSLSKVGTRGRVELHAPEQGWVLFGANGERGLAGAWLVMAYVDEAGRAHVEEHLAAPPQHARIDPKRAAPHVTVVSSVQNSQGTTVVLDVPLRKRDGARFDLEGAEVELIVAYSESDDLQHHSRRREHRFGVLLWPGK